MKYFTILLLFLACFACKSEINTTTEVVANTSTSTKLTKEAISKIKYIEYGIDKKAKVTLDSWQAYNTISSAVDLTKKGDFTFFETDDEVFKTAINEIETTVPPAIDSEPINARILILRTKLLKFREAINLNTSTKKDKLQTLTELFQSFSYVTLQINKKYEKEAQNIIQRDSI